jgi:hypothetical protein
MTNNNFDASLADAAWRNGRECAEVAFLKIDLPWSEEQAKAVFTDMAEALIRTYPGGEAGFLARAQLITIHARDGFDERLRELMAGMGR